MSRIHEALIACMQDIEAVGKSKSNTAQGYKFRSIDDVVDMCHGLFKKHKIFILTSVKSVHREQVPTKSGGTAMYSNLVVQFTFVADDGSCVTTELAGEGMDSGDKATNKALSAALKYCLGQTFLIPFSMEDSENDSPEIGHGPSKQPAASGPLGPKKWTMAP